jgi:hypothetical protein
MSRMLRGAKVLVLFASLQGCAPRAPSTATPEQPADRVPASIDVTALGARCGEGTKPGGSPGCAVGQCMGETCEMACADGVCPVGSSCVTLPELTQRVCRPDVASGPPPVQND